ncbi:MAG: YidB family protein, partial [Gemmatimonadaceae bacterium]|nr:YidB family protein [Gemmatimonadaceae bacterium]
PLAPSPFRFEDAPMLDKLADTLKQYLPDAGDALVDKAMHALHDPATGGLHGLVAKLQASGLGDTVNSWIAKGENLPISADALKAALGNEHVVALASKFGIDPTQAADRLAALLPSIVDKATPDGTLPSTNG